MTSLGEMVVSFKADITNLTQGAQRAQAEIKQVGTVASETGSKMEGGLGSAIGSVGGTLLGFTGAINMAVGVLQGLASAAMSVGQVVIGVNAPMEQASVTMETLMHSSTAAQGELKQLWDFAANTPFEFAGVESAGAKLLAVGFAAKDVIPDLTAIGDALSALGQASDADLNSVVQVFGQMLNTGHLMAQDMMQLTDRGIPAWRLLSEQMHLSVAELQNMTSKGLIPAQTAINALTKGMEQAFGGGMQKQSKTFLGLWSTIHDNIESAMRSITGPAFQAAKKGLEDLGNIVSSKSFQAFADLAGKVLAPAFELISRDIDQAAKGLQAWFDQKSNLDSFSGTMHDLGNTIYDVWRAIKKVGDYIPTAVNQFDSWSKALDLSRTAGNNARISYASLGDVVGGVITGIAGMAGMFVGAMNSIMYAIKLFAEGLNLIAAASNAILGTNFGFIDLSAFNAVDVTSGIENTRSSSGNFGGPGSDSGGPGDTGGPGGGPGGPGGSGKHHPPKKHPAGSTGPGGNVAPPGSSGYGSGIGTGGSGSANNILIVIEIDGQVFASQVVQQVYDQVRLRLGPGGFAKA